MLTRGDDYPLHQTAEPIAYAGTDRNFYDRYFFNGYAPDGSSFFAVAFGVYPHLDVADAHFCVVRNGVQHCLHASRRLGMERMALECGPIRIEIVEPLQSLRVIVNGEGIAADLTFTGRAFPIEEPRFTWRIGPRTLIVEPGVQRLHNEVGGHRAVRPTVKAAGVLGAAYGAYEGKQQIEAAIDTARSNREQWVRGADEAGNQGARAVITGTAATLGAIPGAAAGTLTSPVTGPVGPVVGGLATGGAAAYGAEKLYEDSRAQQFIKYLGGKLLTFS